MTDGSTAVIEMAVNPNDPHKDDEELQIAKAIAAARVHFKNKYDQEPSSNQLSVQVIR